MSFLDHLQYAFSAEGFKQDLSNWKHAFKDLSNEESLEVNQKGEVPLSDKYLAATYYLRDAFKDLPRQVADGFHHYLVEDRKEFVNTTQELVYEKFGSTGRIGEGTVNILASGIHLVAYPFVKTGETIGTGAAMIYVGRNAEEVANGAAMLSGGIGSAAAMGAGGLSSGMIPKINIPIPALTLVNNEGALAVAISTTTVNAQAIAQAAVATLGGGTGTSFMVQDGVGGSSKSGPNQPSVGSGSSQQPQGVVITEKPWWRKLEWGSHELSLDGEIRSVRNGSVIQIKDIQGIKDGYYLFDAQANKLSFIGENHLLEMRALRTFREKW